MYLWKFLKLLYRYWNLYLENLLMYLLKHYLWVYFPFRGIEHQIELVLGSIISNKSFYRCYQSKIEESQVQVDGFVTRGYMRPRISLWLVMALLVSEKDRIILMCFNNIDINNTTIKYRYYIPMLYDMLDELYYSGVFSKVNVWSHHHHIRMKEWEECKMDFKIKGRLYKWLVMPFGLFNSLSTFMWLMNEVWGHLLECLGFSSSMIFSLFPIQWRYEAFELLLENVMDVFELLFKSLNHLYGLLI